MRLDHYLSLKGDIAPSRLLCPRVWIRETELPFAGYSVVAGSLTAKRREGVLPDIAWDEPVGRCGAVEDCAPPSGTPGNKIIGDFGLAISDLQDVAYDDAASHRSRITSHQ